MNSKKTGFWRGVWCSLFHRVNDYSVDRVLGNKVLFVTCRKCGNKCAIWL